MVNPPPKPTRLLRNLPPPPSNLEAPEAKMWTDLVSEFSFTDPASLSLLQAAMESHQRARRCRIVIDEAGEAYTNRFGEPRKHPLLSSERESRQSFIQAMRALRLDVPSE